MFSETDYDSLLLPENHGNSSQELGSYLTSTSAFLDFDQSTMGDALLPLLTGMLSRFLIEYCSNYREIYHRRILKKHRVISAFP